MTTLYDVGFSLFIHHLIDHGSCDLFLDPLIQNIWCLQNTLFTCLGGKLKTSIRNLRRKRFCLYSMNHSRSQLTWWKICKLEPRFAVIPRNKKCVFSIRHQRTRQKRTNNTIIHIYENINKKPYRFRFRFLYLNISWRTQKKRKKKTSTEEKNEYKPFVKSYVAMECKLASNEEKRMI